MKSSKIKLGLLALLVAMVPASVMSKGTEKGTVKYTSSNLINFNEVVDGESVGKALAKAKELKGKLSNKFNCVLELSFNSPGGSIQSGLELADAIEGLGCKVNTTTQFAASMAFQLVQNLGKRQILKNGVLMSHRARGGFEGEFGGKFPSQVDSRKALWESRINELDGVTVARNTKKITLEQYREAYDDELWMTGTQAVERGYADEVVTAECDSSLSGVTTHEVMFMGIIPVKYDLDNCPLNTAPMNIRAGIITTRGMVDADDFVKNNGGFGPECLINAGKVNSGDAFCALDTSLTLSKVKELKFKFLNSYSNMKTRSSEVFGDRKAALTDYWGI